MTYFKKMLLAAYNNSPEIKAVVQQDRSGYGEIILSMEDYRFLDSIVALDKLKLTADSAQSIERKAEGAAGKRVFEFALTKYNSKWLSNEAAKRSALSR